ncbi:major facilitator superfamily domain-containing protein [Pisolithus orientalis]|uniref:major facilitator superfamily domain-containing protein n=1 Tax=Pisolithus orientalis TaxID=936130 RepID=UPI0022253384|nr:major facilitator superfamily domain-containing protein [Pisolithus orientalis]KAI6030874.1 major facilitator superfamily domain-containing protein [Pisolithus orientalis]
MTVDESSPLLENSRTKTKTPLPKTQLGLVLFVLLTGPMSAQYIFPFINQLIRELDVTGGDDRKVGYYAGIIESLFYVTQALTMLYWSRLSDHIGRKPVLLVGLMGLSVSNLCFGLSRTFWTLVASRCIAGALNGNVGVLKSVIGEITDNTNMAQAFALIPVAFTVGASIAYVNSFPRPLGAKSPNLDNPLYGGSLGRPHDYWPELFSGSFWVQYPYFLPCVVSASFAAFSFFITALFLKESLPLKRNGKNSQPDIPSTNSQNDTPGDRDTSPVPTLTLLKTYSVMLPIANYGVLALVDIGLFALVPLFYSTPVEIGGLGLSPFAIGVWMMAFGIGNGLFQILFVARAVDRFGERRVFCSAVLAFFPIVVAFPIMSWVIQAQKEVTPAIWVLVLVQLLSWAVVDAAYAVLFVFVTRASPNKHSLGTVNGISQTTTSTARAIGPATFTSLFAFSREHDLLGGNLVYAVLLILLCLLVFLSRRLPELEDDEQ